MLILNLELVQIYKRSVVQNPLNKFCSDSIESFRLE